MMNRREEMFEDGQAAHEQGDHAAREMISPRAGWDQSFARMAARGDDQLLDSDASTSLWDEEEWEWQDES